MTANVSIIIAERQNTLKVPNAALRFRPPEAVIAETKPIVHCERAPMRRPAQEERAVEKAERGVRRAAKGVRAAGPEAGPVLGVHGAVKEEGAREMGGTGVRPRPERQLTRTVYVLPARTESKEEPTSKPTPVQVKIASVTESTLRLLKG